MYQDSILSHETEEWFYASDSTCRELYHSKMQSLMNTKAAESCMKTKWCWQVSTEEEDCYKMIKERSYQWVVHRIWMRLTASSCQTARLIHSMICLYKILRDIY